jgi:hypothetical protein
MSMLFFIAVLLAPLALVFRVLFVDLPRSAVLQARNNLFALRAELFEIARSGEISFESQAYQMRRYLLNGLIRYADDISFTHFFVTRFSQSKQSVSAAQSLRKKLDHSLRNVNSNTARKLQKIELRAHSEMLLLMSGRSLIATLLSRSVWAVAIIKRLLNTALVKCELRRSVPERVPVSKVVKVDVGHTVKTTGLRSTETFRILRKRMSPQIDGSAWKYVMPERDGRELMTA